jgi:hypothetical protein
MATTYTTTDLINRVKRNAMMPTSQNTFTDARFVEILNEVMLSEIVPMIKTVNEEFFITIKDYSMSSTQREYDIPTRAVGGSINDVDVVTGSGDGEITNTLTLISTADMKRFTESTFYLKNNKIRLNGQLDDTSTVRMRYEARPNNLVVTTDAAQISAIDTDTNIVTVSSIPATWSTGEVLDMIKQKPHFDSLAIDQTTTLISSTDITFSSLPSNLAVGDWLAQAEHSPIAQIPVEAQILLCQGAAVKCLEALGDMKNISTANRKYEDLKVYFLDIISPRVGKEVKTINNQNRNFD